MKMGDFESKIDLKPPLQCRKWRGRERAQNVGDGGVREKKIFRFMKTC